MDDITCPTECDSDCEAFCHESHVPGNKRDHWPEDCPGHPLRAEVSQLRAERDALAAELDTERHEYTSGGTYGGCGWRRSTHAHTDCGQLEEDREHRTARVVLAEQAGE